MQDEGNKPDLVVSAIRDAPQKVQVLPDDAPSPSSSLSVSIKPFASPTNTPGSNPITSNSNNPPAGPPIMGASKESSEKQNVAIGVGLGGGAFALIALFGIWYCLKQRKAKAAARMPRENMESPSIRGIEMEGGSTTEFEKSPKSKGKSPSIYEVEDTDAGPLEIDSESVVEVSAIKSPIEMSPDVEWMIPVELDGSPVVPRRTIDEFTEKKSPPREA
ncbi:hypothetical protein BT63DRAFT_439775 [Microthyrium microscopicum]|uniref:Uncharacterized protein n=1 Tax=Microthyrium microscopicum TaxID=703497 RepID=A0A6A6UBQ4_9PEZI|nr:hypothetical protein BT63DRAFT_439775 [Microthyrium microscopicum]